MNNDIRNSLTEHNKNYRLMNPYLMDCYVGLSPNSLAKISLVLFNFLLNTKKYFKPESRYYTEEEERRIYTNVVLKPRDIVRKCNPVKVYENENEMETDSGNLVRKINEIDEINIFYVWKCGYPHIYMFIMERDIGVWKFYNQTGYVIPKTMKKILTSYSGMIKSMDTMLRSQNQIVEQKEIENSYGQFINRMISKMNPSVSSRIKKWDESESIKTYVEGITSVFRSMDPYEGMVEDENFLDRLPPNVGEKLRIKPREVKVHNPILEKDIYPKEENIIEVKEPRKEKVTVTTSENNILIPSESIKATVHVTGVIDPFHNCNEFIKFYRKSLTLINPNAKFFDYSVLDSERKIAGEILDMLIVNGRNNDVKFLRSWISYYHSVSLKGEDIKNVHKTSLKGLKESFSVYNKRYLG